MIRNYSTQSENNSIREYFLRLENKRGKIVCRNWSNLPCELLGKIFHRLHIREKRNFLFVCRSWRAFAKEFLATLVSKSPFLLLSRENTYSTVSWGDEVFITVDVPRETHAIGSCRGGWLLLTTKETNLILWNPLVDIKIYLPSVLTLPCVKNGSRMPEDWITKAVLFGFDPISISRCGIVIMYGVGRLAFVKYGDSEWSDLGDANHNYFDVTCSGDSILVLSYKREVEVWSFNTSIPRKAMEIKLPFPRDMPENEESQRSKYSNQFYIVESQGNILLVVRWIGNFVDPDGFLRTEDELIEEDDPLLICPYMTKNFYVYKLDSEVKTWVRVESLGNQVLFLGGNQSMSLQVENFAKNSIYFTDDYWDRMEEHDCYGGHDNGIFNLEDGNIKELYPSCDIDKMSPPFWILPSCNNS